MSEETAGRAQEAEWAALVAIDWGDEKHAWTLQAAGSSQRERGELEHTPEAIEAWINQLRSRFGERPVAVCLEQSRGALLYMLSKYRHLVLYPAHPASVAHLREALHPSGAKDDPTDADLLMDLLLHHRAQLRCWKPDTEETRTLQFLVEDRRKLVDEKTRCLNRLTNRLKMYFPQVLSWFGSIDSPLAYGFLERWPTLEAAQKARGKLRDYLRRQGRLAEPELEARLQAIRQAIPATHDQAVIGSSVRLVQVTVQQMRVLGQAVQGYDKEIEQCSRSHPDLPIFHSLPGAGQALMPRLIAALGTQRDRFGSATDLQNYSGIAPVMERSGRKQWIHWRWACPKFVRQTFQEWAQHSIPQSGWARAFYEQQRAKGKRHHAAVRSLAYKWIRILYRCWKERVPYDENVYLQALGKRRPPSHPGSSGPVNMQWKNSAGFAKFSGFDA